jgi:DNA-binding NarL/FixJ family response regulator
MGDPLCVSVAALDPLLAAGVQSALSEREDIVLTTHDAAQVTVVAADTLDASTLDIVSAISGAAHRPSVVLLAARLTPAQALSAIAAGARSLLLRPDATAQSVVQAVLATANDDCVMPPDLLGALLEHRPDGSARAGAQDRWGGRDPVLSDRERVVLNLIASGRDTAQIARELCYSTRTVSNIVQDITRRFDLRNRAHAVAYALQAGLL